MAPGRTFSDSDTQRDRVGPNYLQLPIDRPRVEDMLPVPAELAHGA